MRTLSAPLITLINSSNQFYMADLYTIAMNNGTTIYYTTAESPITYNSKTYASQGLNITRNSVKWAVGIEVDTLTLKIGADATTLINGVPIISAAVQGQFDGAVVVVEKLFLSNWSTPVGTVSLFTGTVSDFTAERNMIELTAKSRLETLNVQMPPNLYQATCLHTLYSEGCTVKKSLFTSTSTVTSTNADGSINTPLAQAANYFNMGALKFTSGANTGLTRTVKSFSGGTIYFTNPFPFPIASGTAFSISPGCDKLRTGDCTSKYSNTINFKGFEFIPVPETAA